jgi:hypothetical protein
MYIALLLGRQLLAIVITIASFLTLAALKGYRKAIYHSGLPTWLASPPGGLSPFAELARAALLVPVVCDSFALPAQSFSAFPSCEPCPKPRRSKAFYINSLSRKGIKV